MSEKLTIDRPREADQSPRAVSARLGREILAPEAADRTPAAPILASGWQLVIEVDQDRVELEPLSRPAADWEKRQRLLVGQLERLGRPVSLQEFETGLASLDWPPSLPNGSLLLLLQAHQQGQLQHIDWGVYAPPDYPWRAKQAGSMPVPPTSASRILDILAWARGPASLQTIVEKLKQDYFQPASLSSVEQQTRRLMQAGRLHHQGRNLYALVEHGITNLWLSKLGVVRSVVDQLLASQAGVVHTSQILGTALKLVEVLSGHVDEAVTAKLAIGSNDVSGCLRQLSQKELIERIDNRLYARPGYDPAQADRLRALPWPARSAKPKPAPTKPRPRPKASPSPQEQKAQARREQLDCQLLELIGHRQPWTKAEVLALAKQAGIGPDKVRRRLPTLVEQGQLQELDAHIYAGCQFDSSRYQAEPNLYQRVTAILEAARQTDRPLVKKQELVDRLEADGYQRPSGRKLANLLTEMVDTDQIQRPRRGIYAAREVTIERRPTAQVRPGLGRRIMRVVSRLDDESLFEDDAFLLDDLFERVSCDGSGPVNRDFFDGLAMSMVERRRRFRRDNADDEDD